MRTSRALWTLFAFAALVACQSGSDPPSVLSFTADPPEIAAGESSTLRWLVSGASSITIAPDVGDVSSTNSAVVSPATTTTYTLTAAGIGDSATAEATVVVDTTIDVEGRVLGLDGRVAPTVLVTVLGAGTTTTAFDGSFVLPDVEPPYDIHVRHPTEPLVVSYLDLTLERPVLIVSGTPPTAQHTASIYGTISGGTTFPQPASHVTRVTLASPATRSSVDADGASGAFQIVGLPWFGADTPAALHALQWRYEAGLMPVDYTGHGTRPLTLRSGIGGYLGEDMALLPVGEGSVSGSTQVPPGHTLLGRTMSVVYPEGGWVTPVNQMAPPASFDYVTPLIPDATIAVTAAAATPANELSFAVRAGLPTTASGVDLVLAAVPELTTPADGAADVGYHTDFSWSADGGGVAVLLVNGPAGAVDFAIVTGDASASVPDLREVGHGLSSGAYTWQVMRLPLYASVDAAASDADGLLSSWPINPFYLPRRDGTWAQSLTRAFTTVP